MLRARYAFTILALTVGVAPAHAQSPRAMALDDLLTAVRVTEPAISPDGRLVAYVRTTTDLQTGKRNGDIYVVPADGSSPPKLFAGGDGAQRTPQFSPDSRQIAFISSQGDGVAQVYVADVSTGSPKKITSITGGVQPPLVFSPNGRLVAFVADVFPACRDDADRKSVV